jgi:hypothetical protein
VRLLVTRVNCSPCVIIFYMKIPSLWRVSGKKEIFECSVCHEQFERKPDVSASREFANHVRTKHRPKSESGNQAALGVARKSVGN